jgi:hypothetical protein
MVAPTRHSHTTMRASARAPAMLLTEALSKGPTTLSTRLVISLLPRQTVPRSTSQARFATTRMPVRSQRRPLSP